MSDIVNIQVDFESFWSVYPRRHNKKAALKAFDKLSDVDKFNCITGAKYQASNNPQWKDSSLIPLPTTFINNARWEDEIVQAQTQQERIVENGSESPAHTVWSAMTQMYGNQWVGKFGERPNELWRKMLKDIPVERLKRGLRRSLEASKEFPPSLPKFLEYCSKSFEEQYPTALPRAAVTDKETALSHLKSIQEILNHE